jgi:hypothetical protein
MESLRWWLLFIAAVMFSMSGCASSQDWAFNGAEPRITEQDMAMTKDEGWWGHLMTPVPPADLSGRWVGTWKGLGLFDSLRQSAAELTLVQQGPIGVAHLVLEDTVAAGVPWVMRQEGSRGVRLVYRVSGSDAWMRHRIAPSEMTAAFTLVDDKLVGTLPNADSPVVITLSRAK